MEKLVVTEEQMADRRAHLYMATNGMIVETETKNEVINHLRFKYNFMYMANRLIGEGVSIELSFFAQDDIKTDMFLNYIHIDKEDRNKGKAKETLALLTELADTYDYDMVLEVSDKFGSTKEGLRKLYSQFGFIDDDSYSDDRMVRKSNHTIV